MSLVGLVKVTMSEVSGSIEQVIKNYCQSTPLTSIMLAEKLLC